MNLGDLRKCNAFSTEHNDSQRYIAQNATTNMIFFAKEIVKCFEEYEQTDRNSRLSYLLFSTIRDNLNGYVQTFMDCVIVLCDSPTSTLRGLIRFFLSQYDLDADTKSWVEFLIRRNDLVHDYLSYDFLNEELYNALLNYNSCVVKLAEFIRSEIQCKNLMEVKIRKS